MQIGKMLFPITTLGPGRRVGVWLLGCNRGCRGCSNPELQAFDESKDIPVEEILRFILAAGPDGVNI